jgi:hypothetical protein
MDGEDLVVGDPVLLVVVNVQVAARPRAPEGRDGVADGVDRDPVVVPRDPEEHGQAVDRADGHPVGRGAEQRPREDGGGAVGLGSAGEVLGDDAGALREADQRDAGQCAAAAARLCDRRLDRLERPAQAGLVVLHRVVEAPRVPGAIGGAGEDVGDVVVEAEAGHELVEHVLGVLVAAVHDHRCHRGAGVAGGGRLRAEMRVVRHVMFVMRTVVRRANGSRRSGSAPRSGSLRQPRGARLS